jgi:hypothetical protein
MDWEFLKKECGDGGLCGNVLSIKKSSRGMGNAINKERKVVFLQKSGLI